MLGRDVIHEVSLDLNDQEPGYEYTRWSVEQLQAYLREALFDVSGKFKEQFIHKEVVQVQPGAGWQTSCNCTEIVRVLGESTDSGRILRYLQRREDIEENVWAGDVNSCAAASGPLSQYSVSAVDSSQFRVYPPVRGGDVKYVLVECFQTPDGELDSSVPESLVPMIKQWMLYRALMVDSENNATIIQVANTHRETFMQLLKAAIEMRELERKWHDSLRTVQKSSIA